ncbi:hypothetical protein [Shewanella youngdeokensis]|uniref:Uncharacterized protein n=1 Tax=Shewanella youngdeokensis TaxID=2999068 RepID=A0ABZ0JX19_9GAMM|nr:hypothetical protein RGE70_16290 [Shewanella sp. DAU334]
MDFSTLEAFIKSCRYSSARTNEKKNILNLLLLDGGVCSREYIESQSTQSASATRKAIDELISADVINTADNDENYVILGTSSYG